MRLLLSKKVLLLLIFLSIIILLFYTTIKDVKFNSNIFSSNYNVLSIDENTTKVSAVDKNKEGAIVPGEEEINDTEENQNVDKKKSEYIGLGEEEINKTEENQLPVSNVDKKKSETIGPGEEDINKTEAKQLPMKYILQWTSGRNVPFVYMGVGQKNFIDKKCEYTNCYVTADRNYLGDYTKFDVIAFAGPEVIRMSEGSLPKNRAPHQKYVFANIESADNYPVCSNRFNRYFNWTWTFRLDSEVRWGYMTIRDKNKNIVGPNKIMHWMKLEDMDPVTEEFKEQLKTKSKAVAWFVSNCYTRNKRGQYVQELQKELKKYNLEVDIYGNCGPLRCSRDNEDACHNIIKEKYYFYLSFENSFDEDYVTEKLLHALNYNAIPVVYGAANYTRFMPDGIYYNARKMSTKELARKMHELIQAPEEYANHFKWKNHYSYHGKHEKAETDEYCLFCTILNDKELVKKTSIYENFKLWWDPPGRC